MRSSRSARLVRGSIAAGFATFVALFAHVASGGLMPGLLGIAAPLLLSLMVSVLVSGRRHSLPRLSISVVVSQLLFHSLFVLGTPSTAVVSTGGHHATILVIPASAGAASDPGLLMGMGHALAALVTIAALALAEQTMVALAAVLTRFRRWWTGMTETAPLAPVRRITVTVGTTLPTALLHLDLDVASRRGPPALPAI